MEHSTKRSTLVQTVEGTSFTHRAADIDWTHLASLVPWTQRQGCKGLQWQTEK